MQNADAAQTYTNIRATAQEQKRVIIARIQQANRSRTYSPMRRLLAQKAAVANAANAAKEATAAIERDASSVFAEVDLALPSPSE